MIPPAIHFNKEAWEGGYCPYGSVEGRLTFKEAAAFDTTVDVNALGNVLKYDMHAGQWCVAGAQMVGEDGWKVVGVILWGLSHQR